MLCSLVRILYLMQLGAKTVYNTAWCEYSECTAAGCDLFVTMLYEIVCVVQLGANILTVVQLGAICYRLRTATSSDGPLLNLSETASSL
jgi:hypothetical protein